MQTVSTVERITVHSVYGWETKSVSVRLVHIWYIAPFPMHIGTLVHFLYTKNILKCTFLSSTKSAYLWYYNLTDQYTKGIQILYWTEKCTIFSIFLYSFGIWMLHNWYTNFDQILVRGTMQYSSLCVVWSLQPTNFLLDTLETDFVKKGKAQAGHSKCHDALVPCWTSENVQGISSPREEELSCGRHLISAMDEFVCFIA